MGDRFDLNITDGVPLVGSLHLKSGLEPVADDFPRFIPDRRVQPRCTKAVARVSLHPLLNALTRNAFQVAEFTRKMAKKPRFLKLGRLLLYH